jgi:hypothetical protein
LVIGEFSTVDGVEVEGDSADFSGPLHMLQWPKIETKEHYFDSFKNKKIIIRWARLGEPRQKKKKKKTVLNRI